jgi:hypothetical protein
VAGLAWNLWSAVQQPLGLFNGMAEVGGKDGSVDGMKWVSLGVSRWLRDAASMENTVKWIVSVSPFMANRAGTSSIDLREVQQTLRHAGGWFDQLLRTATNDAVTQQAFFDSYMSFINLGQRVADVPTWLGGYLKAMDRDPGNEARAIALADQAVLDSQGGGHVKDLAEVERGGPVARLFMTFASYSVTYLNSIARAANRVDSRSPSTMLTFMGHMMLLTVMPAVLVEAMRCGVGRSENCDDPQAFLAKTAGQALTTALNGIIYVRELAGAANLVLGLEDNARGYGGPASARPFQVATSLAQQIHQGVIDEGLKEAIFAASGILFSYPAAQVQRSVDGWLALEEGRTDNPAALLFGAPPKK